MPRSVQGAPGIIVKKAGHCHRFRLMLEKSSVTFFRNAFRNFWLADKDDPYSVNVPRATVVMGWLIVTSATVMCGLCCAGGIALAQTLGR